MRKWLLLALAILLISGCSLSKFWKWVDQMDWERDDQTIKVMRILIR